MKTTLFKKMIKEAVKEAIQEELREILLEAVKAPKQVITESAPQRTVLNNDGLSSKLSSIRKSMEDTLEPQPTKTPSKPVYNLKNKILNEVLNSTTSIVDHEEPVSVLDTMKPSMVANYVEENPIDGNAVAAQVPLKSGLENIFNRDYSGLMKAIDNKKTYRP